MRFVRNFVPLAVILTLGAGVACKKPAPAPVAPVQKVETPAAPSQADADAAAKRAQEDAARRKAEADAEAAKAMAAAEAAKSAATQALPKEINFDLDKSLIRDLDKDKLQTLADYLKSNPQKKLLIDGHCDERGTIEYNLALGDRRASAAQSYLTSLGVSESRITTNSYGKERPKIKDRHDEEALAANRRDEFTIQ